MWQRDQCRWDTGNIYICWEPTISDAPCLGMICWGWWTNICTCTNSFQHGPARQNLFQDRHAACSYSYKLCDQSCSDSIFHEWHWPQQFPYCSGALAFMWDPECHRESHYCLDTHLFHTMPIYLFYWLWHNSFYLFIIYKIRLLWLFIQSFEQ